MFMKYFVDNIEEAIKDLSMNDKEICNRIIKYYNSNYQRTRNLYGYSSFKTNYVKDSMKTLFLINKYFYLIKFFKMLFVNSDEYYEWIIKIDMQEMGDFDKILRNVKSYLETYIIKSYGYLYKGSNLIISLIQICGGKNVLNKLSKKPTYDKTIIPRTQVIFDHYDSYVKNDDFTLKIIPSMYELELDRVFISEEK